MQDNLKKHIEERREEFESFDFDQAQSWSKISEKLTQESKPKGLIVYWKYAVAACLVLATGWVAFNFGQNQNNSYQASSEFSEVEVYYTQEIEAKLLLVNNKVNDPLLLADLASMDEAFSALKSDLKDNVDNAEVVAAMMENYRLKLKILERILEKINEDEEDKDESGIRL